MSNAKFCPRIGQVYAMQFCGTGSEQRGLRPGLVLQNNTGNQHSPNIIALPITSAQKKTQMPTHVSLSAKETGLKLDSTVLCENPERMSKDKIGKYITTLPDHIMKEVAKAWLLSTSAVSFLDKDELVSTWETAVELNKG